MSQQQQQMQKQIQQQEIQKQPTQQQQIQQQHAEASDAFDHEAIDKDAVEAGIEFVAATAKLLHTIDETIADLRRERQETCAVLARLESSLATHG